MTSFELSTVYRRMKCKPNYFAQFQNRYEQIKLSYLLSVLKYKIVTLVKENVLTSSIPIHFVSLTVNSLEVVL